MTLTRRALPAAVTHAAAAITCALLLFAVGQPIFTDDAWWHLALGRAFAMHGPWLAEDPLLFAPAGPPAPASWLADVALAGLARAAGFYALRVLHVAFVAAILWLVWSEFVRACGSRALASLGALAFGALAAYRLAQLRPDLVSIAFCLLAYRFLVADDSPPSWRRASLAALGAALWANLHAAFPLGLLLVGAATAGLAVTALWRVPAQRSSDLARARRLAAVCALATLATLANPAGVGAWLAYFTAGATTPALERVVDEWARVDLLALPVPPLPPSPLAWAIAWATVLGLALAVFAWVRARAARALDPARLGAAIVAVALMLSAVRFLWLGVFALLFFANAFGGRSDGARAPSAAGGLAWVGAGASLLLSGAFFALGDWPAITRGLPTTAVGYAKPYPVVKYYAHAIWLIADSGLSGHLYNDYFLGGFAGYWLAPNVRSIVNGTLNVSAETLDALQAISQRRGQREGEDLPALLDRLGIDLFLGIRLPDAGLPGRHWTATTAHLEGAPGWIPIFRNSESALYLRASERNRDNLARIANYYAEQRVPFDRERGFEICRVIREAPDWAFRHGAMPPRFPLLAARAELPTSGDTPIRDRVAALYAVLGCYSRAAAIDRGLLRDAPDAVRPRRRLVWSLLRTGAYGEAREAAEPLEARPNEDGLSHLIAKTAREAESLPLDQRVAALARLPFLVHAEVGWLSTGIAQPDPRPAIH
jgi:hypothetical protein